MSYNFWNQEEYQQYLNSIFSMRDMNAFIAVSYTHLDVYKRQMYMWPLLVTGSDEMRTVQIGISMLDSVDSQSITLMIAGVVMVIIPSISIFIVGQKQLIRGMFAGAVKG